MPKRTGTCGMILHVPEYSSTLRITRCEGAIRTLSGASAGFLPGEDNFYFQGGQTFQKSEFVPFSRHFWGVSRVGWQIFPLLWFSRGGILNKYFPGKASAPLVIFAHVTIERHCTLTNCWFSNAYWIYFLYW